MSARVVSNNIIAPRRFLSPVSLLPISVGGSDPTLQDLVFWIDVSEHPIGVGNRNIKDKTGTITTSGNELQHTNINDAVFTNDPGWLDCSAGTSADQWAAPAVNSGGLVIGTNLFTVACFLKITSGFYPASNTIDIWGKRSADNAGPGWKFEIRQSGILRLRLENASGSASGIDLTGLPTDIGSVLFFWARRNSDGSITLKEEFSGLSITTAASFGAFNIRDDGEMKVASVNSNFYNRTIGDMFIWMAEKSNEEMSEIFNVHKGDHGL